VRIPTRATAPNQYRVIAGPGSVKLVNFEGHGSRRACVGLAAANAAPAAAAYGAFAYDDDAHRYGYSWNQETAQLADETALKGCKTDKCKVVFHTGPKTCGAIALTTDDKVWGGATRDNRPAAELAAIENCQKHTTGQCKVRASECNR
jgi:hypothetical protein